MFEQQVPSDQSIYKNYFTQADLVSTLMYSLWASGECPISLSLDGIHCTIFGFRPENEPRLVIKFPYIVLKFWPNLSLVVLIKKKVYAAKQIKLVNR